MPRKGSTGALTELEKRFVKEYLVDCNASRAYVRANPSTSLKTARTLGARLLAKVGVSSAIQAKQKTIADKLGVTEEAIIAELRHMALARLDDYITVGKDGKVVIDLTNMTSEQSAALAGIETETYYDKYQECEVTRVKLRHHDKKGALDMLGKYMGARGFGTNKMELSGANGGPINVRDVTKLTREQLRAIVAAGPNTEEDSDE